MSNYTTQNTMAVITTTGVDPYLTVIYTLSAKDDQWIFVEIKYKSQNTPVQYPTIDNSEQK